MRNALLVVVCLIAVLGCGSFAGRQNNESSVVDKVKPSVSPSLNRTAETPKPEVSPSPTQTSHLTELLKSSKGKYPYDIKLMENPELKQRLEPFMNKDFAVMKKFWNVETPIEIENGILKTSGCEQHNCAANMWVMFVDADKDNFNIYHLNDDGVVKTYFEKGKITLPPKFADEVNVSDK